MCSSCESSTIHHTNSRDTPYSLSNKTKPTMVANNEPIDPNLLSSSEMTSDVQVISEVKGSNPHPPKSSGKPKAKKATDTTDGEESTSKGRSRSYVELEDLLKDGGVLGLMK
jgi:hypothetical protein